MSTSDPKPVAPSGKSLICRVSLVDDDRGTRESVSEVLRRAAGIELLEIYASAEEAIPGIRNRPPDVALVDIKLGGMSGIECVQRLKLDCPAVEFLMLTTYDDSDLIFKSLQVGASGYLLKRAASPDLVEAIMLVHSGGSPMSIPIARKVVNHFRRIPEPRKEMEKLTPREHEILSLLAQGYIYKEIADKLDITVSTVRAHLHSVYGKLHVQTRTEAVIKFLKQ